MGDPMNKHTGSDFDDFLGAEGILEEATARAQTRLLTLQSSDVALDRFKEIEQILVERPPGQPEEVAEIVYRGSRGMDMAGPGWLRAAFSC